MKYKLFFTPMCPNCPIVKEFMKTVDLDGELLDASTPEGLQQAQKYDVAAVPTVLFFEGDELRSTCQSIDEIKRVIENKTLV
jgi:ribonucleoside-triphosphate reductase|tara:strand:- start:51 stop:296 length:246 start_codon:yes stop_codon:yes gene_type:complete